MAKASSWDDLHPVEPFRHSWLPDSLLSTSTRAKPHAMIWALFGLLPVVAFAGAALLDGTFYIEGDGRGLMEDWFNPAFIVTTPVLLSVSAIVYSRFPNVLISLRRVIAQDLLPAADFDKLLKEQEKTILAKSRNSRYLAIALFVGLTVWAGLIIEQNWFSPEAYGFDTWHSRHHKTGFIVLSIYNVLFTDLGLVFLSFKFITISHVMRRICLKLTNANVIRVRPMYPDRAGGLGTVGTFSLQMVLILAVGLLPITTGLFNSEGMPPALAIGVGIYFCLLIYAFFYPLSGAHRAMRDAKAATLLLLSQRFNRIYDEYMAGIDTSTSNILSKKVDEADTLGKLYEQAQRMPVWPFNLGTVSRFGGILLTVVLTVWLKFVIGWISGVGW